MITMQDWMQIVEYKISEGYDFGWNCFGSDAYSLSSWNQDQDGYSSNIVFDTKNHTVYSVEVCDYKKERAYRMINPDFKQAYKKELGSKEDYAWDDVSWTDLEVDTDWLEKAESIFNEQEYDTRVLIPLELPDHEILQLFKMAHEADMSFNNYIEKVLRDVFADEDFVKKLTNK